MMACRQHKKKAKPKQTFSWAKSIGLCPLVKVRAFSYTIAMLTWKFFIITFGCKVNQYESQSLREAWPALGGAECADPAEADVICINSCAVTAKGERDARNAVFRLRRRAPKALHILTGCAARLFIDYRPAPGVEYAIPDLLLPQEKKSLLLLGPFEAQKAAALPCLAAHFPPFQISSFTRARPVLKLQDGCSHGCTYCIVPLTRGPARSRPPAEILAEARRLLEAGHAEIMLSGINLRQYGRDAPEYGDFWDILRMLDTQLAPEYYGRARLRISSLEPSQLNARGTDVLQGCRLLCPHLHISLQHASPTVLRRMGRGHYSAAMLEEGLATLARSWPVMGLGADILTGFPGENDDDLRLLTDLIARLPMSYAHVFPYSRRPGTAAANFAEQVPDETKHARAAHVRQAVAVKRAAFLQTQASLPRMMIAADSLRTTQGNHGLRNELNSSSDNGLDSAVGKGVNEFYTPCFFQPPPTMPMRFSGLLSARPTGLTDKGLLVEIATDIQ